MSSTSNQNSIAYINGRIYTINPSQPWVEAFIVSPDGTFAAVGSTGEISTQARRDKLLVHDLQGQFIMPGLHDAHVHMLYSALADLSQIRLPMQGLNASNIADEVKKGACLCKYAHANQDWLVGHTYMIEDFDQEGLDKQYPDTPVVIRAGAGHSAYLNSEALRRAGYDVQTEPDGQGTKYMRDSSGKLTGELAENAMSKVMTTLPKAPLAHVKRCLKHAVTRLHRAGVTSCQEAATSTLMLHAFRQLDAEGQLKLEIATHIVYAPDWIAEEDHSSLHATLDKADTFKSTHVDTRFVKIILDGVPLPPYYTQADLTENGEPEHQKLFITNLAEAVQTYDSRGMTMKIHCTGHGSTRFSLDTLAAARKANSNGPKHEIAHCSGVHDNDYKRFKELNVTAEMSPAFFFSHPVTESSGGLMDWNFPKMQDADASMTIGSDWGAGEEPDLLPCVARVVEKIGNGDKTVGGQRLCRWLTLSGAEAVGRGKELGSIEVGKKANFIAVDKNLAEGEFEGANVTTTWFEGEIVFEKSK